MNYRNERIFVVFTTILAVIFLILISFIEGITPFQNYLIGTITGCGVGVMWAYHRF